MLLWWKLLNLGYQRHTLPMPEHVTTSSDFRLLYCNARLHETGYQSVLDKKQAIRTSQWVTQKCKVGRSSWQRNFAESSSIEGDPTLVSSAEVDLIKLDSSLEEIDAGSMVSKTIVILFAFYQKTVALNSARSNTWRCPSLSVVPEAFYQVKLRAI